MLILFFIAISALLLARAAYILYINKKRSQEWKALTTEEQISECDRLLTSVNQLKIYQAREASAKTIWLTHSTYKKVYPGDPEYSYAD